MLKQTCSLLIVLLMPIIVFSQNMVIRGNVDSIPDVNIWLYGTEYGTSSNKNGEYSFTIPNAEKPLLLQFTKIGYADTVIQLFSSFNYQDSVFLKVSLRDSFEECLKKVSKIEKSEFVDFYTSLSNINFFSINDEYIDKTILQPKFDEIKKTFYLHLTDRCNFNCTYCFNSDYRNKPTDLSFEKWKIIIDKIAPYAATIILTGGEALLHQSFNQIVSYIKNVNSEIQISLFSNGGLNYKDIGLKDVLDKIDLFNTICDNIRDEKHERIGFDKHIFKTNLKYLESNGYSKDIAIHSVWTKGQLNEIKEVRCFCESQGFKSVVSVFIPNNKQDMIKMPSIDDYSIASMLRVANDVDNKNICKDCNLKYVCSGGCIANTCEIEGGLLEYPETMC